MASVTIKLDFDAFPKIQGSFRQQAETTQKTIGNLKKTVEQLKGGDWFGEGATAFFNEMDSQVLPSMTRLKNVLDEGDRVSKEIEKKQHETENNIIQLFQNTHLLVSVG
ncbi:MAG TPA: WXG100 family type VII secretion target [Anaerolineales bacterium]|nr:WXG100 family type VII secretion target [Anaerolineales bacterium]